MRSIVAVRLREQIYLVFFFHFNPCEDVLAIHTDRRLKLILLLYMNKSTEIFSNGRVKATYPVGSFGRLCAVFRRWHVWHFGTSHVRHDLLSATTISGDFFSVRRSECKDPLRQSVVMVYVLNRSC